MRDWENVFVITLVLYIGVPFHAFYYYWAEVDRSSDRGSTVSELPALCSCKLNKWSCRILLVTVQYLLLLWHHPYNVIHQCS